MANDEGLRAVTMTSQMATPIADHPARWRLRRGPETSASQRASASCYRRIKNFRVVAIVVAELKFRHVQRHVFAAHLVERADRPTFEDRPKAFNRVGVDRADNVFASTMIDHAMRKFFTEMLVANPCVGSEQANFGGYRLAHKSRKGRCVNSINHPRDHVSLAADRADDWRLTGTNAASPAAFATLVSMLVLREAADKRFIDFHNAHEFLELFINQRRADTHAHVPSGAIGAEAHHPMDLKRADPLLARQHQMNHAEPLAKVFIRVLKDRARDIGKSISAANTAVRAFPMPFAGRQRVDLQGAATRAMHAVRPAVCHKVRIASIFVGERLFPFGECHLRNLLRLLGAGHIGSPIELIGNMA